MRGHGVQSKGSYKSLDIIQHKLTVRFSGGMLDAFQKKITCMPNIAISIRFSVPYAKKRQIKQVPGIPRTIDPYGISKSRNRRME